MKKLVLTCLFIVSFQGCAEENYIKLSDNLKDDLKIEMYLANDDSCVKLDKPFDISGSKIESLSEKPFLTNEGCSEIYFAYSKYVKNIGIIMLLKDKTILERERGDSIVIKINQNISGNYVVGQKAKGSSFFWLMSLSQFESNVMNKNKIYYDKIKEIEDLREKNK